MGQLHRQHMIPTESGKKLSNSDLQFVKFLVETGNKSAAYRKLIDWELENGMRTEAPNDQNAGCHAKRLFNRSEIQEEYWRQMEEVRSRNVADATEVMMYFTSVMRGEVKDQFGLDASLSDRTQAAKELAKRTVDMENRMAGKPDAVVSINLNWNRD